MNIALPLGRMTIADKIRTMEQLWDDLSRKEGETISPSWHEDVLKARSHRVAEGKEPIYEWEHAKKRIRKSIP